MAAKLERIVTKPFRTVTKLNHMAIKLNNTVTKPFRTFPKLLWTNPKPL